MEAKKRARIIVTGRVQGVFFREETRRAATGLGVAGWVRNRRDGSVEAIAEGDPAAVDRLLDWCRSGPPLARVDGVDVVWQPYTGEFEAFDVRR